MSWQSTRRATLLAAVVLALSCPTTRAQDERDFVVHWSALDFTSVETRWGMAFGHLQLTDTALTFKLSFPRELPPLTLDVLLIGRFPDSDVAQFRPSMGPEMTSRSHMLAVETTLSARFARPSSNLSLEAISVRLSGTQFGFIVPVGLMVPATRGSLLGQLRSTEIEVGHSEPVLWRNLTFASTCSRDSRVVVVVERSSGDFGRVRVTASEEVAGDSPLVSLRVLVDEQAAQVSRVEPYAALAPGEVAFSVRLPTIGQHFDTGVVLVEVGKVRYRLRVPISSLRRVE